MVELSNGDITSGSERLLAVENNKALLMTNEKAQITCEWHIIDMKHLLSTNRKPWSLNRQVTLFRVSDAYSDRNRKTAIIDQ
jgi:hypothetical protein